MRFALPITFTLIFASGLLVAQEQNVKQKAAKNEAKAIKLSESLSKKKKAATYSTSITAKVINNSSSTLTEMRFGFQDSSGSGDPVTAEIYLGTIAAGSTKSGSTTLPTGFEVVLVTYVANGERYSTAGFGNNATSVELEVTD